MGIISHHIKCYAKNKRLAANNSIGSFKKNRSADEKTHSQRFGLNNNSNDWMFMLTLSKVCNHPENAKLNRITRVTFLASFPLCPLFMCLCIRNTSKNFPFSCYSSISISDLF